MHGRRTPAPTHRNKTIAATLIEANQYSDSPHERTDSRFSSVNASMRLSVNSQGGACGNQNISRRAPATASSATTMTQKYQYIHPVMNPASSPEREAVVFVEPADRGVGHRHLPEHAHHQHHERTGEGEREHGGGPGLLHDHAAADEEPGADHAAERDHFHVAPLQGAAQGRGEGRRHQETPHPALRRVTTAKPAARQRHRPRTSCELISSARWCEPPLSRRGEPGLDRVSQGRVLRGVALSPRAISLCRLHGARV